MNNLHAKAIYNTTKYPMDMILTVLNAADHIAQPFYPVGTMQWDVWQMLRVLREYERLQQPTTTA